MHVSSDWAAQTAIAAAAHLAVVANREAHAPPMQVWNAWCYLLLPTKTLETNHNTTTPSRICYELHEEASKNGSWGLNLSRSSSQQKYLFHSPLPIIWSKNKNDTTNLRHIYRNFNISVRPFQLLPIGPRSPGRTPDPWFLLLDGRWFKSVENKKTDWKKGWHKEPTCKGWLVHILSSYFLLIHCFTWFLHTLRICLPQKIPPKPFWHHFSCHLDTVVPSPDCHHLHVRGLESPMSQVSRMQPAIGTEGHRSRSPRSQWSTVSSAAVRGFVVGM